MKLAKIFGLCIFVLLSSFIYALQLDSPENAYFNTSDVLLQASNNNVSTADVSFFVNTSSTFVGNPICFFENVDVGDQVNCTFSGIPGNIPTSGLVLYLKMNNYSGASRLQDDSGEGNSIVTESGVIYGDNAGVLLGGYTFDGTNDYLAINDAPELDITSSFTIAAWVWIGTRTTGSSGRHTVVSKDGSSDYTGAYNLYVNDANPNAGFTLEINNLDSCNAVPLVPDEEWHHVAATLSGGTMYMYLDGQAVTTTEGDSCSLSSATANSQQLIIGRRAGGNGWLNGTVDEVMIYNTALSASQMANLYALGDGVYYWKVNGSNGEITATQNFTIDTIYPTISRKRPYGVQSDYVPINYTSQSQDTNYINFSVMLDSEVIYISDFNDTSQRYYNLSYLSVGDHNVYAEVCDQAKNCVQDDKTFVVSYIEEKTLLADTATVEITFINQGLEWLWELLI